MDEPIEVRDITRLKGGYSREMWSVDVVDGAGSERPLVLCLDAAESVVGTGGHALDRVREGQLLRTLHEQGVPVPNALCWGDSTGPFPRSYLVMERIGGTSAASPLLRLGAAPHRRRRLGRQMASMLASVHAATVPSGLFGARQPDPERLSLDAVEYWSEELESTPAAASAPVVRAVGWMSANLPPAPDRVVLVHGDYRTGNLLHSDGEFSSILDWEMAHLGDALEDVAWAALSCWRFGTGRVGSLLDEPAWCTAYGDATGRAVDGPTFRFWKVLGAVKMAVLLQRAVDVTPAGDERSLLERLLAELNVELLQLVAS